LAAVDPDPASLHCIVCNADKSDPLSVVAIVISLAVLAFNIATFFFANFRNRRQDQSAKVDEAWFKAIVLDDCLPELQKFCSTQRSKFEDLAKGSSQTVAKHRDFLTQFSLESEALQRRLAMVECMSLETMQATLLEIEALGDVVVTNASKVLDSGRGPDIRSAALLETVQEFDKRSSNCLTVWKKLHHSLQVGKKPS
jgi:hypothetical protein